MTTTRETSVQNYLAKVRSLLADLDYEEREEVLADLEAHLAELDPADPSQILGSPEEFVDELRATAGFDSSSRIDRRLRRVGTEIRNRWLAARPVWVGIRGWLAMAALAILGSDRVFDPFPIPRLGNNPLWGVMAVVLATWVSYRLAQLADDGDRGWRAMERIVGALVAVLVLSAAPYGLYTEHWAAQNAGRAALFEREYLLGLLPENLEASDPQGRRLDGVVLYDQDGRPFDLVWLRSQLSSEGIPPWELEELEPRPRTYPLEP
jgi:hypothetical protein